MSDLKSQSIRANNYDFLRIVAASMVIVGHAFPLTGNTGPIPTLANISIHEFAVIIFFSVSGFLVTRSAATTRSVANFVLKRSFRIFPALVVLTSVTAILVGPLLSNLGGVTYFQNPDWTKYFYNILLFPVYSLPGVFGSLPYPNAVNGSLWTLPVEIACYVIAATLVVIFRKRAGLLFLLFALFLAMLSSSLLERGVVVVIYGSELSSSAGIAAYFFVGGLIYFLHCKFSNFLRIDIAILVFVIGAFASHAALPGSKIVAILSIPYLVIAFGELNTPILRRFGRFGDPSYGIYLWAFPIQQVVLSSRASELPIAVNILLVTLLSVIAGYCSWYLVEKRAIALGQRIGQYKLTVLKH